MKTIPLPLKKFVFGDNDTLAGFVSNLMGAEVMMILTDQQGLFSANPRRSGGCALGGGSGFG